MGPHVDSQSEELLATTYLGPVGIEDGGCERAKNPSVSDLLEQFRPAFFLSLPCAHRSPFRANSILSLT